MLEKFKEHSEYSVYDTANIQHLTPDSHIDFFVEDGRLCIDGWNLLWRCGRVEIDGLILRYSPKHIENLLSEYGKSILGIGDSSSLPQIDSSIGYYEGRIGNDSILMVWDESTNRGVYAYKKYRLAIHLKGKQDGAELWIDEQFEENLTGRFNVSITDRKMTGTWHSPDGKRTYPVLAIRK